LARNIFRWPIWVGVALVLLGSCDSDPEVVELGGATVQRPWGKVTTFPTVEKAQIPTTADLDFTRHMIVHHGQAIRLSELVLKHPAIDDRVAAAARFIAQDQGREITAMQHWIDAWESTPEVLPHGAHHDDPSVDAHRMPGMVAAGTIERLAGLGPDEAQREFVRLMIYHHEGAVTMSRQFIGDGQNDFALTVARHVIREQDLEIDYLRQLKADLCASRLCSR
jgi:uncharacterized protein (DUF305 family)